MTASIDEVVANKATTGIRTEDGAGIVRLDLVRHGETAWNALGKLQGHRDIPLNAHGREQARRVAQALAERGGVDAVVSSPLARARQTAEAIAAAAGASLLFDPDLRERGLGAFEGRTFAAIDAEQHEEAEHWRHRDPDWAPPGGETLAAFRDRVVAAATRIARVQGGGHVVLVAHGGVLDVLYRAATHLGLQDTRTWKIPNASINRMLWTADSGFALVGWADTQHLDAALDEDAI